MSQEDFLKELFDQHETLFGNGPSERNPNIDVHGNPTPITYPAGANVLQMPVPDLDEDKVTNPAGRAVTKKDTAPSVPQQHAAPKHAPTGNPKQKLLVVPREQKQSTGQG